MAGAWPVLARQLLGEMVAGAAKGALSAQLEAVARPQPQQMQRQDQLQMTLQAALDVA